MVDWITRRTSKGYRVRRIKSENEPISEVKVISISNDDGKNSKIYSFTIILK